MFFVVEIVESKEYQQQQQTRERKRDYWSLDSMIVDNVIEYLKVYKFTKSIGFHLFLCVSIYMNEWMNKYFYLFAWLIILFLPGM